MWSRLKSILNRRNEENQGLVEFGLILGLIAVIAIAALNAKGRTDNMLRPNVPENAQPSSGGMR